MAGRRRVRRGGRRHGRAGADVERLSLRATREVRAELASQRSILRIRPPVALVDLTAVLMRKIVRTKRGLGAACS